MFVVSLSKLYAAFATLALLSCLSGCDSQSTEDNLAAMQPDSQSPENPLTDAGVYFSTNRSGNFELVQLHNQQLEFLTSDASYDSWWPRQSPDGRTMLFYRSLVSDRPETGGHNNNYTNAALWSLDLQTGTLTELIAKGDNDWLAQGVVDWSPDGSKLVMAALEASTNRWHLFTSDNSGENPVKISTRSSLFLDPSWSPDGSEIVYTAFPPEYSGTDFNRLEIYTADANGQNERRLTNDNLRDHDPYWSPDGDTIAFESAVNPTFVGVGKWAIRTVSAIGENLTTVLDDGNVNTLPRWSRDGNRILFHRFIFGANHGFVVASMQSDGSDIQTVTPGGGYDDTDLDWLRVIP